MSSSQVIVIVLAVLVVAALIAVAVVVMRRRSLRQRFGPEYDRLAEQESASAAARELRARERRHAELELTELAPEARARYAHDWEEIQARFVDSPAEAVAEADELVTRLISERGYPTEDYSSQLEHLSVEHSRTLTHYREAHDIQLRNARGEAGTEELRQAVVHYRALFADLLGEQPVPQETSSDHPDRPQDATSR
ncbi:hypothetical protein [Melissospora conviva]|uniref:hypothetical protein n=1 Tax=Melissospora conviva TaxID=3388432 RepID=UPI003B7C040D